MAAIVGSLACGDTADLRENAVPLLDSTEPAVVVRSGDSTEVTVLGHGFAQGAEGLWNGSARPTAFVDQTRVTMSLSQADVPQAGTGDVVVVNPEPGGGASSPLTVRVGNPVPSVDSLTPWSAETSLVGGLAITVRGSDFATGAPGASVLWNDVAIPTTVVDATELVAAVGDHLLQRSGPVSVTVVNPPPGGGQSGTLPFAVTNPVPTLIGASPPSVSVGTSTDVFLEGSHFVREGSVIYGDSVIPHEFLSPSRLEFTLLSPATQSSDTVWIRVQNPAPGGGTSDSIPFSILMPPPEIATLDPPFTWATAPDLVVRISGDWFPFNAEVRVDGSPVSATVLDTGTIDVVVPATHLASTGTVSIEVTNPQAGVGADTADFEILPPAPPVVDRITPLWVRAGSPGFVLSLTGNTFLQDLQVTVGGVPVPVTVNDIDDAEAQIDPSLTATDAELEVVVSNAAVAGSSGGFLDVVQDGLPAGTPIAFMSLDEGEIVTATLDGSNWTPLGTRGTDVTASPLNRLVAYRNFDGLYVRDPATQLDASLLPDSAVFTAVRHPVFSGDGVWVYWTGQYGSLGTLWRARADGSAYEEVLERPGGPGVSVAHPAPSSTGDRVGFVSGSVSGLQILDVASGQISLIATDVKAGRWSPDDSWIAYTTTDCHVRLVRPDGSEDREVGAGACWEHRFDWAPDGTSLIGANGYFEAQLLDISTGALTQLSALGRVQSISFYGP
ncbi:MAG: IPT/TIG domain-containing protein [Gemmatimonadota bacterium]